MLVQTALAPTKTPLRPRVAAYDGLRAVAAGGVVGVHAWPALVQGGRLGVDVFFVLSGWLITNLLANEMHSTGRLALGRFYLRRARRLLPPLVIGVVLAIVVAAVAWPSSLGDTERQGLAAILYIGNWTVLDGWVHSGLLSHTWTLGIEEQFYLVWPAALIVALRGGGRRLALGLAVVLAVLGLAHAVFVGGVWVAVSRGSGLFVGSALALVPDRFWIRGAGVWRAITPVASAVLLAFIFLGADASWPFVVLASAVVVPSIGQYRGSRVSHILAWTPLVWVGRRSYALYVLNLPLTALLLPAFGHGPALLVAAGALSVAGASLSWRYIETPVAAWGRARDARVSMRRAVATT